MRYDSAEIIKAYEEGLSINAVARKFDTYPTTVKRILDRFGVEIKSEGVTKGMLYVKDGEKLIEWAKAQGRLVTKAELAAVIGKTKLSPSYFIKYPELGRYVASDERKEFDEYYKKLYSWLDEHGIAYKRNDKTKLKVTVDVLLLGKYSNIAMEITERPRTVSTKVHRARMNKKMYNASEAGVRLIGLTKEHFEKDLDGLKDVLDKLIEERC